MSYGEFHDLPVEQPAGCFPGHKAAAFARAAAVTYGAVRIAAQALRANGPNRDGHRHKQRQVQFRFREGKLEVMFDFGVHAPVTSPEIRAHQTLLREIGHCVGENKTLA